MAPRQEKDRRKSVTFYKAPSRSNQVTPSTEKNGGHNLKRLTKIGQVQTPQKLPKISKQHAELPRRRKAAGPNLMQRFDDALDANRDEIIQWAEASLAQTEDDHTERLNGIISHFDEQLALAESLEYHLYNPIRNESVIFESESPKGSSYKEEVSIAQRMQEHKDAIGAEEKILEELWKDWEQAQAEMMCLAFEVLGEKSFILATDQLSRPMHGLLSAADQKHRNVCGRYNQASKKADVLGTEIGDIKKRAESTLTAQQKARLVNSGLVV